MLTTSSVHRKERDSKSSVGDSTIENLPFAARIDQLEKLRKKRKRLLYKEDKNSKSSNLEAFSFFFNLKPTTISQSSMSNKKQPSARTSLKQVVSAALNSSFEKQTSSKSKIEPMPMLNTFKRSNSICEVKLNFR